MLNLVSPCCFKDVNPLYLNNDYDAAFIRVFGYSFSTDGKGNFSIGLFNHCTYVR